jgi:DNA replication protein DnaC
MLIAQYALRARRTVAIYTAPWLLSQIRSTYEQGAEQTYLGLMERLAAVDLLQLDDMAVASQTDWTLEQLYTIVNRRYEDQRSVVLTADVESPDRLGDHVGPRTASRLLEMCEPVPLFGADNRVSIRSSAPAV